MSIVLSNVKKKFNQIEILDIDKFILHKDEKIILSGENGSGKSTLLKILANLVEKDEGDIQINGELGLVLSGASGYYGYLSAIDNIKYFLGLNKIKFNKNHEMFNYLVEQLNYEQFLNTPYEKLSLGNKQKLALIIGFMLDVDILLLDEPTLGLDPKSCEILANIIKLYNGSVIITTHDLKFISDLDYDVCTLKELNITQRRSASEYLEATMMVKTYYVSIQEDVILEDFKYVDGYYQINTPEQLQSIVNNYTITEVKLI